jgi:hypothetical protein
MSALSITHDIPGGTLVDGTERGDGSAPILKAHRFKWGRSIGCWFIPHSRGKVGDRYRIEKAADALRAGGFEVAVTIDNATEDPAEQEARREARAEQRAEGLTLKAERKGNEAAAAFGQFRQTLDAIPFGQPILVGHHSERGHRAALKRADRAIGRSAEADRERQDAERGARVALASKGRRQSPTFIGNRIREREADARDIARRLAGVSVASGFGRPAEGDYRADLEARAAQVEAELTYWRGQLAECGQRVWTQADFAKGDRALIRGRWLEVRRANKTTLSVESGYSWTDRYPYTEVRDRRAAEDVEAPPDAA